ncbi:TfoX/Sxy family protein [Cognatilysobacter segetis]|uniref:TfoX/Sxy family protein n=1 Tax=Cognatilysobacter segetis TaxID=2492394 RepID=UPI001061DD4F|nr:TfoX/Sxy family protein [Lysobacter segetis]
MATDPATVEFLIDQLGTRGASYATKRMFGEYCLYRNGLPVAFVCDDVLFVKDTPAGREVIAEATTPQFGPPYPGAKLYLRLSPDAWDDGEWLRRVLDATAAALPAPRPRPAAKKAADAVVPSSSKRSPRAPRKR